MDEDEVIKRITRLLEQGCTMLATHHDCGAPLFRCQGKVVCPVCSFEPDESPVVCTMPPSVPVAPQEQSPGEERAALMEEGAGPEPAPQDDLKLAEVQLRGALLRKLKDLREGLEEEQDLDKLKKQLDCVEGLLRTLRSLER